MMIVDIVRVGGEWSCRTILSVVKICCQRCW